MTLVGRTIVQSTGYLGGPGYNILHWTAGVGAGVNDVDGVEEFHDTLEATLSSVDEWIADDVTLSILPDVVYFNDDDGVILGSTTDPGGIRVVPGLGTGTSLSRATQANVGFRTEEYVNGRRLKGRMFLGPIASDIIGADGQIYAESVTDIPAAFSGLISGLGGRLAVWHRPTDAAPTSGSYGDVTTITCSRVPGTLRSRKT
jgi:hypothetical protein